MEDLQGLLERINRDGIEKAEAAAAKILADAKEKSAAIVKKAETEAAESKAAAERAAADYAKRAEETIRQAARDVVIEVKDGITALLEKVLVKSVDMTLADPAMAAGLANGAIGDLVGSAEVRANSKLAAALQAQLAANPAITVVLDENMGGGFTIRTDNGRVEHDFTTETIANELAKRLRPDLAALLK